MTFVPQRRSAGGMNPAVRNILFWTLMVLLAVFLWQMVSKKPAPDQGTELSYSDFMNQVDGRNVQTANITVMQNTADVAGRLKNPSTDYRSTVPRDTLPRLLDNLRQQGTSVQVSEGVATRASGANWIIDAAPILLLIGVWIFMVGRSRAPRNPSPPNPSSPGAIG